MITIAIAGVATAMTTAINDNGPAQRRPALFAYNTLPISK